MGSGLSVIQESILDDFDAQVQLMMPDFYIQDVVVLEDDIKYARASWKCILEDSSPVFTQLKSSSSFSSSTCLTWFYDTFYARLFDINPSAKVFFKNTNMQAQGRVLCGVISTALNQLKNPDGFIQLLTKMTHVHSERGIRAMQYGIIGDVLIYSLRACLGSLFDQKATDAWYKVYSYMLKVIVPISLEDEIREINMFRKGEIPADVFKEDVDIRAVMSGRKVYTTPNTSTSNTIAISSNPSINFRNRLGLISGKFSIDSWRRAPTTRMAEEKIKDDDREVVSKSCPFNVPPEKKSNMNMAINELSYTRAGTNLDSITETNTSPLNKGVQEAWTTNTRSSKARNGIPTPKTDTMLVTDFHE